MGSEEKKKSKKEIYVEEQLQNTPFRKEIIKPIVKVVINSKSKGSYIIPEETYLINKSHYAKDGFYLETDPVKIKFILDNKKGIEKS